MIPITEEIILKAKTWSTFKGNHLTFSNTDSQLAGSIGEIVFQQLYPDAIRVSETDRECDFLFKDFRVDVKTKMTSVNPQPYHDLSILDYQKDFNVDFYCFFRLNYIEHKLWQVATIAKDDYFKKAKFLEKGMFDRTNNYYVKQDCWNLKIGEI